MQSTATALDEKRNELQERDCVFAQNDFAYSEGHIGLLAGVGCINIAMDANSMTIKAPLL